MTQEGGIIGPQRGETQFCDACNSVCNGFSMADNKKLQPKYEGYVLIKRSPRDVNKSLLCRQQQLNVYYDGQHQQIQHPNNLYNIYKDHYVANLGSDDRRRSCGDILDDEKNGDVSREPYNDNPEFSNGVDYIYPTSGGGGPRINSISPVRSLSHGPGQWEKVVNLSNDDNPLLNNLTTVKVPQINPPPLRKPNKTHHITTPTGKSSSWSLSCGHQKLCRKKSKSQENLDENRRSNNFNNRLCSATSNTSINRVLDSSIRINNVDSKPLLPCDRSRSEGNINHVHKVTSIMPPRTPPPVFENGTVTVGDIAKLPKRLLHRVTGEMEQFMYDIEGWKEDYLVLDESAITTRTVSFIQPLNGDKLLYSIIYAFRYADFDDKLNLFMIINTLASQRLVFEGKMIHLSLEKHQI